MRKMNKRNAVTRTDFFLRHIKISLLYAKQGFSDMYSGAQHVGRLRGRNMSWGDANMAL